jgi:tetratricopeptide (TPR) repeat protein
MTFDDTIYGPYDQAEQIALKACEHYEDGQISQAIAELDQALQINPANSCWHFDKALALDSINRFDDAISEYETALDISPGDVEILNALAIDYTRVGLYDLSIETFEQIEQLEPYFEPCYCNRIITYTETGRHELAEQMFYMAQQINPNCPLCFYNIGNSLFIRRLYKKALLCWQKTKKIDPNHPQINYRIAQAYLAQGDIENARNYFLEELRKNAADIETIGDFGLLLLQAGDIDSAKEKFNRILELNPDCAPAIFYLGEIAYNCPAETRPAAGRHRGELSRRGWKDLKKAIALYKQAIEKDGSLPGPRYRLALCCWSAGQVEKAKAYLATELQLSPDNPDVLLSMATIFIKLDDPDSASNCLLKAIDLKASCPDAYYYLGCINILKARPETAAELLQKAVELNPRHSSALKELAHLFLVSGSFTAALEKINQLRQICPNDAQLKKLEKSYAAKLAKQQLFDFLSRLRRVNG